MTGTKIIEGLREAIAGDLARVTIDGQIWTRSDNPATPPVGQREALVARLRHADGGYGHRIAVMEEAADYIERSALAGEALAQRPDMRAEQWQPIESAPKDGTHILALWPDAYQAAFETYWDSDERQGDKPGWYSPGWGHIHDGRNPIGWMPLPPHLASSDGTP